MRKLSDNAYKKGREIYFFLLEKNRWGALPPNIQKWTEMEDEMKKVTFISQSPDNINGSLKDGLYVEYASIQDMVRDLSIYDEWGLINIRPGKYHKDGIRRNVIRLNFMLKKDVEVKQAKCLEEIKVDDFLDSMMKGKIK